MDVHLDEQVARPVARKILQAASFYAENLARLGSSRDFELFRLARKRGDFRRDAQRGLAERQLKDTDEFGLLPRENVMRLEP